MIGSIWMVALSLSAQAGEGAAPEQKPLVVVLPVSADARGMGSDGASFAGMLQSELSSAARGADVLLLDDAAAQSAVLDTGVLRCNEIACADQVGKAVKARYVVASSLAALGKQRVVTVRMQDVSLGRIAAMYTEKTAFAEDSLPAVAARAALRLASGARIQHPPEPPKPPPPAPEPPPPVVTAPTPAPEPAAEPPITTIIVPPRPAPQPEAPPPVEDTPPAPPSSVMAMPEDQQRNVPQQVPVAPPVEKGPRVNWATRVGVVAAGLVLAGWAPLLAPFAGVGAAVMMVRAVEVSQILKARPHMREDIDALKGQGTQYEVLAHVLGVAALGLLTYGIIVPIACIVTALLLP